jgi:hypothetical protein
MNSSKIISLNFQGRVTVTWLLTRVEYDFENEVVSLKFVNGLDTIYLDIDSFNENPLELVQGILTKEEFISMTLEFTDSHTEEFKKEFGCYLLTGELGSLLVNGNIELGIFKLCRKSF